MTYREALVALTVANIAAKNNSAVPTSIAQLAAIDKAADELFATVNSEQVDSLRDEIATKDRELHHLGEAFRAYRERMESPLTDEECLAVYDIIPKDEFHDSLEWVNRYDAAIRKVREGRMP